jgi:hypothetical protein
MIYRLFAREMAGKTRGAYQSGDYLEAAHAFGGAAVMVAESGDGTEAAEMKNILLVQL